MPYGKITITVAATLALAMSGFSSPSAPADQGVEPGLTSQAETEAEAGTIQGTVAASRPRFVANTLVYLEEVPGQFAAPAEPVQMDQRGQQFVPFLLPVVQGTTVRFLNNDNTGHNVFTPDGDGYDLGTWGQGETREYTFEQQGVYTQLCQLHPSMIAYVVVLQNPFFAVTDESGSFEISNVPPGEYQLAVWNERKEAEPQAITVTAGQTVDTQIELN